MRHPLNITQLTLARIAGHTLRLHIWHGGGSDAPHNHNHPITALPLLGRYAEVRYRTGHGTRYRPALTWQSAGGDRRYQAGGPPCGLSVVGRFVRRPLRPYRITTAEIHAYRPIGRGPHLSLVWLGRPVSTKSTVWLDNDSILAPGERS